MYHNFVKCSDILPDVLENIETTYLSRAHVGDNQTGFKNLDLSLLGINKSELVCIAGLPKTDPELLALNIISNLSKTKNKELLIFNLSITSINRNLLELLSLSPTNKIINSLDISFDNMISKIETFAAQAPNGLVFINGLDRFFSETIFTQQNEIENCGLELKRLARKLNIPIIVAINLKLKKEPKNIIPNINDLGIYDIFACTTDKLLTTFHYQNISNEYKQDYFINIAKNKSGVTGLYRYGVYLETEIICDAPRSKTYKSSYARR